MTEEEKQLTIEQIKAYRKMDELVLRGDLYRLMSPFTEEFFAEMLVSKDKTRAYVAGMRLRGTPLYKNRLFRLAGLDPDKTYRIEEIGVTAKGATLMNFGLLLPRIEEYESWAWNLPHKAIFSCQTIALAGFYLLTNASALIIMKRL